AGASPVHAEGSVDLRYRGQGYNVRVPLPARMDDSASLGAALRAGFEQSYRTRYGRVYADVPIDIVNLRVTVARRRSERAFTPRPASARGAGPATPKGRRRAHFGPGWGTMDCDVFDRLALVPGFRHAGPA